jgi:murein DD-endopeptidase MepM/ murein hydrolase activator NlpD
MPVASASLQRAIAASAIVAATALSAGPVAAHDASIAVPADVERVGLSAMSCPVDGETSFIDSWGAGRSGERRHQGIDMISDRGTPIVAALAGSAEFKRTNAGGKSVWLTSPAGDKFFYAHLDDWAGESRVVDQGEVIGFVGSTGNAGGPHLHFEVHPDGNPENPFPFTDQACSGPIEDAAPISLPVQVARRR